MHIYVFLGKGKKPTAMDASSPAHMHTEDTSGSRGWLCHAHPPFCYGSGGVDNTVKWGGVGSEAPPASTESPLDLMRERGGCARRELTANAYIYIYICARAESNTSMSTVRWARHTLDNPACRRDEAERRTRKRCSSPGCNKRSIEPVTRERGHADLSLTAPHLCTRRQQ